MEITHEVTGNGEEVLLETMVVEVVELVANEA